MTRRIPTAKSDANHKRPVLPAWVFRNGDRLHMQPPMLVDTGPAHNNGYNPYMRTGVTRLFRNGELYGEGPSPIGAAAVVPADRAEYRLEIESVQHPNPLEPKWRWDISTRVEAAWTFTSGHTTEVTALPLMAVRHRPELDDHNRAPAGKRFTFPVWVEHQPGSHGAAVTDLAVQASFDDGVSWRPVTLRPDGDRWQATLINPPSGYVSLRATATDADGNTVKQTVERAYGTKKP